MRRPIPPQLASCSSQAQAPLCGCLGGEFALRIHSAWSKVLIGIQLVIALAGLGIPSISSAQQQAASDADLQAVYCVVVLDFWARTVMDVTTQDREVEQVRRKLLDEIKASLDLVTPSGIDRLEHNMVLPTINRAAADTFETVRDGKQFSKQTSECFNTCPWKGDLARCTRQAKECLPKALMERIDSCINQLPSVTEVARLQRAKAEAAQREELEHWQRAKGTNDSAAVQGYIDRYPSGRYMTEARQMLVEMKMLAEMNTKEAEPRPVKVFRDCADCPEMVVIPAGSFAMGSNDYDYQKPT